MGASWLTPQQRETMRGKLGRHRDYLGRLVARMESTH
jgi:hypothetical protein